LVADFASEVVLPLVPFLEAIKQFLDK